MKRQLIAVAMIQFLAVSIQGRDYRWDFGKAVGRQGWGEHQFHGLADRGHANGVWSLEATAGHPQMTTPKVEIKAADQKTIVLRLRYAKGLRAKANLLFITAVDPKWSDKTAVSFLLSEDGEFHTYEIDMAGNPLWKGTVTQLRFDPFYVEWPMPEKERAIHIDWAAVPDISVFARPPGGNLIRNGSFDERGADGSLRGWTKFLDAPLPIDAGDLRRSGNPANSSIIRDGKHGNVIYIRIPPGTKEIGGWQTRVKVRPGTIYKLSFAAKSAGKPYAVVSVNEYKDKGARIAHHESPVKSDRWDTYTLEFQTRQETTAVQFAATEWMSPGESWFDDFVLREVTFSEAGSGSQKKNDNPFDRLTRTVVTPHIPWAVPFVDPPNVLAVPSSREIVELAQRLSLKYRTWTPYNKSIEGYAFLYDLYYERRERGFISYLQALSSELTRPMDVILIGGKHGWKTFEWTHLPETLRNRMLDTVRQGSGLIFVRPTPVTRQALEAAGGKEIEIPHALKAGIPFPGLPVLDKDVADPKWLRCYTLGKGRLAIVDYPNESFGFFEMERSLRRGSVSPFTPDVSYDYRVPPLAYDYYLSFLAKLVIWAGQKTGPVSLTDVAVVNGALQVTIASGAEKVPDTVELEIAVRDTANGLEFSEQKRLQLAPGTTTFSQNLPQLKGGGHFADVWVRHKGKVLDWGSTFFRVRPRIAITLLSIDKPRYLPDDKLNATVRLDRPLPAGWSLRLSLTDSLGRLLATAQHEPKGGEASVQLVLSNAVAILHKLTAEVRDTNGIVIAEKATEVLVRRPTHQVDDYRAFFWALNANNDFYNRFLLADLARKGFDGAFIYYLYSQPPKQLRGLLRNTVHHNFDLGLFAYSLACWNAGNDPTLTISPRCLTRPEFRANFAHVLRQHASVARDYPVFMYGLGDESGIAGYKQDYCFSPTCLAHTRSYLQRDYGTVAALNREWDTAFKSWETVKPMTAPEAKKHGNIAPWTDHRLAMEEMFSGLVKEGTTVIRKEDPTARVGLEGITGSGMGPKSAESSTLGYDFGRIVPAGNFWNIYFQHYPQVEFLRSFAAPGALLGTYTQPFEDYPKGYFADAWRNERVNRFVPWYGLFHGMNSIIYWGIQQTGWHGFYTPDFRTTPWADQCVESLQEIKGGIGKQLIGSRRDHCGIAVHYSQASLHADSIAGRNDRMNSLRGVCHLLEDLFLQYDLVSREQLASGKLKDYRALILPYSQAIWQDESDALRRFTAAGGLILADGPAGVMDGHCKRVEPSMLSGVPISKLTHPVWKYAEVRDVPAGNPSREELRKLLTSAGVKPPATVTPLDGKLLTGCELTMFHNGAARHLGLLQGREYLGQEGKRPNPRPARITLSEPSHIYDVRKREYLGRVQEIMTSIEPAVARLFALLPSPVTQVAFKGLKPAYQLGKSVRYQVSVVTASGQVPPLVVRVDVRRPDGTIYKEYSHNLSALRGGEVQGVFTLALNDPPGTWKMTARSVATGHSVEATFLVE